MVKDISESESPSKLNRPKYKTFVYICIVLLALLLIPSSILFAATKLAITKYPESIKPSEEFCLEGIIPFPNHYFINSEIPSEIQIRDSITILNRFNIFAKKICLKPTELLSENKEYTINTTYLKSFDTRIFGRQIKIKTLSYPEVKGINFNPEINSDDNLKYEITYTSDQLEYSIRFDNKDLPCEIQDTFVTCNIAELNLEADKAYDITLIGKHNDNVVKQLNTTNVKILTPVKIESSSIEQDSIIKTTSIPQIDFLLNKEIENDILITLEDENSNSVKFKYTLNGKNLSILTEENFKQETKYFLRIKNAKGLDSSHMREDYELKFSISGGPTIIKTNLLNTNFPISSNIILTFDQNINPTQNIKNLVKLNSSTNYSYTIKQNILTINPDDNLDNCKTYSINIGAGIRSTASLISSKAHSYSTKTKCGRVLTVGTSVQGRTIAAYYYGSGSKKIIFFASMHGSESNSKMTLTKWITELENNSNRIPADKTIIVIPTFNPDGVANRTRFNANGVDLNRNFDNSSWVPGTYLFDNFYPTGGGITPFSEPESTAIKNLVQREAPYITISYHAAAAYTVPSRTTKSIELAKIYSQMTGYKYISPDTTNAFSYEITGTFESWAGENGYNAIVVELSSAYNDEFTKNKDAMWKMVNL